MAQRIKGQEVTLDVVSPGGREETLTDQVSASITFQFDILKQRLLGETTDRKDDIFRGVDVTHAIEPPERTVRSGRIMRVSWSGARVKGRAREARWDGSLSVAGNRIVKAEPYAFDSPAEGTTAQTESAVHWRSKTCGDADGVVLHVQTAWEGSLAFSCAAAAFELQLRDLQDEPFVVEAACGGDDGGAAVEQSGDDGGGDGTLRRSGDDGNLVAVHARAGVLRLGGDGGEQRCVRHASLRHCPSAPPVGLCGDRGHGSGMHAGSRSPRAGVLRRLVTPSATDRHD